MNNDLQTSSISSDSLEDTIRIGKAIGKNLRGGEVIELLSDIGGGKTTITKGIAFGAGSNDLVSSPSFTLCNEYQAKDFRIYHFDFYRLSEPGIIKQELQEVLQDSNCVTLIEWPDTVENILPTGKIAIELTSADETRREITVKYDEDHRYIIEGLV